MKNTEIYVAHTLESGVEPIEMRFLPLYDCYYHRVIGYTGQGYINSVLYGTLPPAEYLPALEPDPLGADFAVRCLKNTLAALRATKTDLLRVEYVGVLCPVSLLRDARLYDRLAAIAGRAESALLQKIHLEFDSALLSIEKELLKTAQSCLQYGRGVCQYRENRNHRGVSRNQPFLRASGRRSDHQGRAYQRTHRQ